MQKRDLAYVTIKLPSRHAGYVLRYSEAKKQHADGRVLVVALPYSTNKPSPNTLKQPTALEMRQLHKLGLHLIDIAMKGEAVKTYMDPIVDIWAIGKRPGASPKKPVEVAMPQIFMLKKLHSGEWVPGYFKNYKDQKNSELREVAPQKDLQTAANWICEMMGRPAVALGKPHASARLRAFPRFAARREAFMRVARKRREAGAVRDRYEAAQMVRAARAHEKAAAASRKPQIPPEKQFFRLVAWMTLSPQHRSVLRYLNEEATAAAAKKGVKNLPEVRVRSGLEHPTDPCNYEAEIHGSRVATNHFDVLIRSAAQRMGITGKTALEALPLPKTALQAG